MKRIQEADYGCEERLEGYQFQVLLRLRDETGQEIDVWDLVGFEDLHDILNKGAHWTEVFDKQFGYSEDNKGDKKVKTEWLTNLKEIQDKLKTSNMITKDNFDYLSGVKGWLIEIL